MSDFINIAEFNRQNINISAFNKTLIYIWTHLSCPIKKKYIAFSSSSDHY